MYRALRGPASRMKTRRRKTRGEGGLTGTHWSGKSVKHVPSFSVRLLTRTSATVRFPNLAALRAHDRLFFRLNNGKRYVRSNGRGEAPSLAYKNPKQASFLPRRQAQTSSSDPVLGFACTDTFVFPSQDLFHPHHGFLNHGEKNPRPLAGHALSERRCSCPGG